MIESLALSLVVSSLVGFAFIVIIPVEVDASRVAVEVGGESQFYVLIAFVCLLYF